MAQYLSILLSPEVQSAAVPKERTLWSKVHPRQNPIGHTIMPNRLDILCHLAWGHRVSWVIVYIVFVLSSCHSVLCVHFARIRTL